MHKANHIIIAHNNNKTQNPKLILEGSCVGLDGENSTGKVMGTFTFYCKTLSVN